MPPSKFVMPSSTVYDDEIKKLSALKPPEIKPYVPKSIEAQLEGAKGAKGTLKGFFGTDKAAEKSQAILNKRLAELDDPENSKYDQAMAWFKGAAAMQEGSRPLKAMANAFGEVASGYSALKKEQRKARSLIEDSQMLLDRAEQAREDGFSVQALALEDKAETQKAKAYEVNANIAEKQATFKLLAQTSVTNAVGKKYETNVGVSVEQGRQASQERIAAIGQTPKPGRDAEQAALLAEGNRIAQMPLGKERTAAEQDLKTRVDRFETVTRAAFAGYNAQNARVDVARQQSVNNNPLVKKAADALGLAMMSKNPAGIKAAQTRYDDATKQAAAAYDKSSGGGGGGGGSAADPMNLFPK